MAKASTGKPEDPVDVTDVTIDEIEAFLKKSNRMPELVQANLREGILGAFKPFGGEGVNGQLLIDPTQADITTLLHEITHAADFAMVRQNYAIGAEDKKSGVRKAITPAEEQFKNAYEKMSKNSERYNSAMRFNPKWVKEEGDYRSSSSELAGFGVGNTLGKRVNQAAPPHIDASMTTDFLILMDLARRAIIGNTGSGNTK